MKNVIKNPDKLRVILGLGKTGFSCAAFLKKNGCNIAVIDSRENPPYLEALKKSFPDIPVSLGSFASPLLNDAYEIIISPGISLKEPAVVAQIKRGIPVIGDIELFIRAKGKTKLIGITGSNGKSTVTTLVGEIAKISGMKVCVGGNLGTPALDLITTHKKDLYVLELSSFQLETTPSLNLDAAVILNITPDHMDRYATYEEYLHAKQLIYKNAKTCIINRDDPNTFLGINLNLDHTLSFGLSKPFASNFGFNEGFLCYGEKKLVASSELKIKGHHQISNVLASLALSYSIGLPFQTIIKAIVNFRGLPHRCQWVRNLHGVAWYNDSKGTNVGATKAAISGLGQNLEGKIVLIAGGIGKNADFKLLYDVVEKYVRTIILIGKDAKTIAISLQNACKIIFADSMQDAVLKARDIAQKNDAVLLSPACASFDMFANFEERGEVFSKEVKLL